MDVCCYGVRSGCPWRLLPKDFPPWQDVYAINQDPGPTAWLL